MPGPTSALPEGIGAGHSVGPKALPPPMWACSGRGLPSRRVSAPLVRSYPEPSAASRLGPGEPCGLRTISPLPRVGRYVSVALSVGLPRLAFRERPALWSPDFPHPGPDRASGSGVGTRPPGPLSQWQYTHHTAMPSTAAADVAPLACLAGSPYVILGRSTGLASAWAPAWRLFMAPAAPAQPAGASGAFRVARRVPGGVLLQGLCFSPRLRPDVCRNPGAALGSEG